MTVGNLPRDRSVLNHHPLGQSKPALQVKVIPKLVCRIAAGEQTGAEAFHHPGHVRRDRAAACVEAKEDLLKGSLAAGASSVGRIQGRVNLCDLLDVPADFLLLGPDEIQASVNACRQPL